MGFENLYIHDLYVENNIAYCSQGETGYVIWDCSDVDNITYLGSLDDGSNYNLAVGNTQSYICRHPIFYVAEEVPGDPLK